MGIAGAGSNQSSIIYSISKPVNKYDAKKKLF